MELVVKGVEIKLLDRDLMRRFGGIIATVDPSVAKILVEKKKAIYINGEKQNGEQRKEQEEETTKREKIFPKEIIKED